MQIPHSELEPEILRAVLLEFVTRDGTDDTSVEKRIESVLRQLESGRAELHYDEELKSCNVVAKEGW